MTYPIACTKTYTVVSNDNCYAISQKFNIVSEELYALNAGISASNCPLQIGQVLCVATATPPCAMSYTTQSGDYCSIIASNNGIT